MKFALVAAFVIGCTGGKPKDVFIAGHADDTWVTTKDGKLRIPLVAGIAWQPVEAKDALVKMRGEPGPTFVVASEILEAPKPLALATCADVHRKKLALAFVAGGVVATAPTISDETRGGAKVPRLHYAVPLEEKNPNDRPASLMASWTYFAVGDRCVAVGVTTVVRSKPGDPTQPDPEDLARLDRVYQRITESTVTP